MAVLVGERQVEARAGSGYRPHLDGLRAIAVYLVVLFHAGVDRFSGGFIGVDVFFVLSGYLVTQLLMRDLSSGRTVRFGRFYARRMRRLLPASAVLLLVTAVVYSAIASPAEIVSAVGAFKAAFLYVANWYFIHQSSDYFATDINANPVIHFWSLAIEEQFYFVWPVLLAGLWASTRRFAARARVMQGAVVLAGFASLLWALHLATTNVSRAYYGTDARAYQLLAGAFLALSPGLIRRAARWRFVPAVAAVALAVLVVLASSFIEMNVVRRGIGATIITATLIIAIEAVRAGPVNKVLSSSPFVYLGKISYGTYLWHWPVILVALNLTDDAITPLSLFMVSALVATGLASLSYTILERPIREQKLLDRVNPVVIITGLGISVLCALVVIPYILDPYRSTAATIGSTPTNGFTPTPKFDFEHVRSDFGPDLKPVPHLVTNCYGKPSSDCTVIKGSGPHILVIGDSHAEMMFPTFAKIARDHNLTLSTAASGGCPWQRNLYLRDVGDPGDQLYIRLCKDMKRDLYERVIPELKPDVIIVWTNDYLTRRPGVEYDEANRPIAASPTEFKRLVRDDTQRSIKELLASAGKVLIAEPVPTTAPKNDPFSCLTRSSVVEECRFVANPLLPIALIYRDLADNRRVLDANFDLLVCPFMPICDPVIGGMIVRFDNQHLTPKFAVSLADPLWAYLRANRLVGS